MMPSSLLNLISPNLFALWTVGKHIANEKYGWDPWEYQHKNKSMHGSDEDFILQKLVL